MSLGLWPWREHPDRSLPVLSASWQPRGEQLPLSCAPAVMYSVATGPKATHCGLKPPKPWFKINLFKTNWLLQVFCNTNGNLISTEEHCYRPTSDRDWTLLCMWVWLSFSKRCCRKGCETSTKWGRKRETEGWGRGKGCGGEEGGSSAWELCAFWTLSRLLPTKHHLGILLSL